MVQRSAMIPVRITQRPQVPHENKYLHALFYDNFRKCNKTATPRNCIQIKLDDFIDRRLDDFMVFRPRQRRQTLHISIQIDNNVIERMKETVFLGVILDEHLS